MDAPWLSLAAGTPVSNDSCVRLRHFERANYYLWQANRSLADFWGPEESAREPYFEAASHVFLEAAKELPSLDAEKAMAEMWQIQQRLLICQITQKNYKVRFFEGPHRALMHLPRNLGRRRGIRIARRLFFQASDIDHADNPSIHGNFSG